MPVLAGPTTHGYWFVEPESPILRVLHYEAGQNPEAISIDVFAEGKSVQTVAVMDPTRLTQYRVEVYPNQVRYISRRFQLMAPDTWATFTGLFESVGDVPMSTHDRWTMTTLMWRSARGRRLRKKENKIWKNALSLVCPPKQPRRYHKGRRIRNARFHCHGCS